MMISLWLLLLIPALKVTGTVNRSFTVDYNKHTFMKDGEPFRYISGSFHYSRVPYYYWQDRLQKVYAAGLDAIQVYVPWNVHEPSPGVYDFQGQQDLVSFLKIAQQENLLVILRGGPYICGEWEFGGFPAWILRDNSSIVLRTMDPGYLKPVDRWLNVLLQQVKPMLYENGGNIIMVQVENEYGSYFACDHDYLGHLVQVFRKNLGDSVVLFSTDGNGAHYLKCGTHEGLFATVDFGPTGNVTQAFSALMDYQPNGPLVNSEYYTGWLDHWGHGHSTSTAARVTKALKDMLDFGASVNMYMFEGGTNFGFHNGANGGGNSVQFAPTSYDYDAPLSEAGDITEKYTAVRQLIGQYKTLPKVPVPPSTPKSAYGKVVLTPLGTVHELLPSLAIANLKTSSVYPLTMEQVGQSMGFIMYKTHLKVDSSGLLLNCSGVQDMGYVLLDGVFVGLMDRNQISFMNLIATKGQELSILVENQGRINYGKFINNNVKGIIYNITLGGQILTDWQIYPLNFTHASELTHSPRVKSQLALSEQTPAVYTSRFTLPQALSTPQDTYLDPTGWFKGQAYINGFNLGRYWPVLGPQVTLYVPKGVLRPYPAANILVMVELQRAPCPSGCFVNMTDTPNINKTVSANEAPGDMFRNKDLVTDKDEDTEHTLYFKTMN